MKGEKMFFRKAKRIKEQEDFLDFYAKSMYETKEECRRKIIELRREIIEERKDLRDKERMIIAAMLGSNQIKLEFSCSDYEKAKNYRLRHVVNPMIDWEWIEVEEIVLGKGNDI